MAIEIERKFLVHPDYQNLPFLIDIKPITIEQGYLFSSMEITLRVRRQDSQYYLTIKGLPSQSKSTLSRIEVEKELTKEEYEELHSLTTHKLVTKKRYHVLYEKALFEVDVFERENHGLILIELELKSEAESFPRPPWLGSEVTEDPRYYNAYLSENPFSFWAETHTNT